MQAHAEREAAELERMASIGQEPIAAAVYRCMADVQAQPIEWLWPGLLARGKVALFAGQPGLGKSQASASIAATLSQGAVWPVTGHRAPRGAVIIVSAEDDASDTIKPRLEAAGAEMNRVFILDGIDDFDRDGLPIRRPFNLQTDMQHLEDMIAEVGEVALLSIDPLSAYLGGVDSHKNADVRALLSPLKDLAERTRVAFLVITHLNKGSGNNDALSRVTGSMAFVAAARTAFLVTKDKEDDARPLLLTMKSNIGADQFGLAFKIESVTLDSGIETSRVVWERELVHVTADEAMAPADDERDAVGEAEDILRSILESGPLPANECIKQGRAAGVAEKTLRRAKKSLGVRSAKSLDNTWRWTLPRRGAAAGREDD